MQIDVAALKQAADAAVEAGLTKFVTAPEKSSRFPYNLFGGDSTPTSPMEDAVAKALREATKKLAADYLNNDPRFRLDLEASIKEAVQRALVTNREKTVEGLASAISSALGRGSNDDD